MPEVDSQVVIERDGFAALIALLRADSYRVVGPRVRDGAIVLDELSSETDVPVGWGDERTRVCTGCASAGRGGLRVRRRPAILASVPVATARTSVACDQIRRRFRHRGALLGLPTAMETASAGQRVIVDDGKMTGVIEIISPGGELRLRISTAAPGGLIPFST